MLDIELDWDSIPPNVTQHFYPTDDFLMWLGKRADGRLIVDVGAGRCDLTRGLRDLLIACVAIEPRASQETRTLLGSQLLPLPVSRCREFLRRFPILVVVARPDHSGWVETVPGYLHTDSEFLYVGLEKNYPLDIPDDWVMSEVYNNAGRDGETVWRKR